MTTLLTRRGVGVGLLLQWALENPKARRQDPEGILHHSSSAPNPIVEDHLLPVHIVAGVGPH